jgi:hypothetical protein
MVKLSREGIYLMTNFGPHGGVTGALYAKAKARGGTIDWTRLRGAVVGSSRGLTVIAWQKVTVAGGEPVESGCASAMHPSFIEEVEE